MRDFEILEPETAPRDTDRTPDRPQDEFTIDPIYSGVDGGGDRPDRHRALDEIRTPAERATLNPDR